MTGNTAIKAFSGVELLPVILGTITSNNCEFCGLIISTFVTITYNSACVGFKGPEIDPSTGYFYSQRLTRFGNSTSNIW